LKTCAGSAGLQAARTSGHAFALASPDAEKHSAGFDAMPNVPTPPAQGEP